MRDRITGHDGKTNHQRLLQQIIGKFSAPVIATHSGIENFHSNRQILERRSDIEKAQGRMPGKFSGKPHLRLNQKNERFRLFFVVAGCVHKSFPG